ncbi:MAG TPA: hypothetical protein PKH78_07770 [Candidatus Obscuribacter sp.]|nr:hypothetical protein [Candidatus Obscuribacter sp.]MBK9278751.1 hypothetical protein [Candidatus Obscuribacter sp.]MBL8084397.1 hypothetical protein [Candidatus Obscuribacter sp.]HND69181.1 hypothetical protein [Candidatus Obscuribacter sp.]HNN62923.1 hypothetical protein [Candidatus Obscuribacter sp.]
MSDLDGSLVDVQDLLLSPNIKAQSYDFVDVRNSDTNNHDYCKLSVSELARVKLPKPAGIT